MGSVEIPRNTFWERLPESVVVRKMVGEPGTKQHRELWKYEYKYSEWAGIVDEMSTYTEPEPDPEPEPEPEPAVVEVSGSSDSTG